MKLDELKQVLEKHMHWIKEDCDGWEEMCANLSGANLYGANLSQVLKGRTFSDESRKKMSESKKSHFDGFNGIGFLKHRADGYISAFVPDHPNATADGMVMLHTIVMERHIGRYLNPDEVVHHVNHIRNDNRLENLILMKKHDHMSMHMLERHAKRRNDLSTALS